MGLEDLQLLVLDEADRLLEMGFSEEVLVYMLHQRSDTLAGTIPDFVCKH